MEMDRESIIVRAIADSVNSILRNMLEDKLKDTIQRQLQEIKDRLIATTDDEIKSALSTLEKNPTSTARQALLAEELRKHESLDERVVELSRDMLRELEATGIGKNTSNYNIAISGSQGLVIGDGNSQINFFRPVTK